MHVPLLEVVTFKTNMRMLWARITLSRLTTIYFTFSVLHCVVQLILQSRAFQINNQAAEFLLSVVVQGNALSTGLPVLDSDFRICDYLPTTFDTSACEVVWDGTPGSSNTIDSSNKAAGSSPPESTVFPSSSITVVPSASPAESTTLSVVTSTSSSVTLSPSAAALEQGEARKTVTVTIKAQVTSRPVSISSLPSVNNVDMGSLPVSKADANKELFRRQSASIQASQTENGTQVTLNGFDWHGTPAVLDQTCLLALNYPLNILQNTKREDIVFIAFQLWVLGMSVLALLNESIPHILASMLTHMVATGWAGFQISHTAEFRRHFFELTVNGACEPLNLLPQYWKNRGRAEISSLTLNIVALFLSAFLTWKLVKLFGWQTFKRIGASLAINRCYKFVLTLSITIQLALFFMFVSVSLWLDQLFNGLIGRFASLSVLYKVTSMVTLVLLIPWLMIGWVAVRRELRVFMAIFLLLCLAYLAAWAFMFISGSFRWTFVQWRFFSLMTSASVLLTLATLVLGIVCRINFGKGLPRYLQAQEILDGDDSLYGDMKGVKEKIDFPSRNISGFTALAPGVPINAGYESEREPFGGQVDVRVQNPPLAHTRSLRKSQYQSREGTIDSGDKGDHGRSDSQGKRWVIE